MKGPGEDLICVATRFFNSLSYDGGDYAGLVRLRGLGAVRKSVSYFKREFYFQGESRVKRLLFDKCLEVSMHLLHYSLALY